MKKIFNLFAVLFITSLFFAVNLNAQYCGGSGAGVCTPGSFTLPGFYPPYDSLPCVQIGVPYDQIIQLRTPATVVNGGSTYTLNYVQIDTLRNLPCGLCWRTSNAQNRINGNSTGCVRITGTTYDAPGQYKLYINVTANVQVPIIGAVNSPNHNGDEIGAKYWGRVAALDGSCAPVDTLAAGNQAHSTGTAATIALAGNTSVCTGGSSTFSISNAASYYAYKWSTGAITSSISVSTGGVYTVTAYAACSSVTASRTLTVNTAPTPTVTANGATTFCSGGSVTLDAGAGYSAYSWSSGQSSQTINVSQAGNYTVTVTQNGCTGTSNTITVTVNSNPAPVLNPWTSPTFCAGGSVTLDAGGGYDSYAWSSGETGVQTISATQSGNYNVTVTQNGCSGTSNTVTVTVNSNPTPTVNANGPLTFCAGGSVTLDAGAGYSAYAWSSGGAAQTLTVTQSGSYEVTVTQNGCPGVSSPVTVTVNSLPTPLITAWGPTDFCIGGDVWLNAPTGYDTYLWSSGATTESYTATQTGDYTLTVTQGGCSGTSNLIHVNVTDPTPTINANGPTTFCTGGSVTLDAGPGFATYAWSDLTSAQTTVITAAGTYDVTTTLNGCTGTSAPVVITVSGSTLSPVITANPSFDICPGGNAVLDAGVGYDSYAWSTSSINQTITETTAGTYSVTVTQGTCTGTTSATLNVGNFPVAVNISPAGPVTACTGDVVTLDAGGTYDSYLWSNLDVTSSTQVTTSGSYIVTVISNACIGTDTVDVTFNSILQPAISPASPVNACTGDVLTLDAGAGFDTYSWSNGGVSASIQPVASGSYSVTVTQNGCSGSDTVDVTFNAHPVVAISPAGPITGCEGDVITLDAGAGFSSYSWSTGDGTQTIQSSASGTFIVTAMQNGCAGTDTVEITLNALPQPVVTPAGPVSACAGDNVVLDAGSGFTAYAWSNGDLTQTTQPTSSGSFIVSVTQNGCTAADTVDVTFNAIPHAVISPSGTQNICTGESVTLDAGAGFGSYQWTNSATTQTITVDSTGSYDVTVTQSGCSGASTNPVTVFVNVTPNASITVTAGSPGENILTATPAGASLYTWITSSNGINGPFQFGDSTHINSDTSYCIGSEPVNPGGSRSFFSYADIGVVVTSSAGCSDTSNFAAPASCTGGIDDLKSLINFNLQPNPANEILNISYDLYKASTVAVSIVDLTGRKIMNVLNETQNAGDHRHAIGLSDLASGIYLLNFTTEFGSLNTKFVRE